MEAPKRKPPETTSGCLSLFLGFYKWIDGSRVRTKKSSSGSLPNGGYISIIKTELRDGRTETLIFLDKPPDEETKKQKNKKRDT